jgi:ankyrin repeat protein
MNEIKVSASSQAMVTSEKTYSIKHSQSVPKQVTGLHLAAYFGLKETIITLLENGHDSTLNDTFGWSPLLRAAEKGHEAMIKLLLDYSSVDVNPDDDDGRTLL